MQALKGRILSCVTDPQAAQLKLHRQVLMVSMHIHGAQQVILQILRSRA